MKNERIVKGFDWLAPIYSCLTGIVFGKSLEQAQNNFLPSIQAGDQILILGGGSGDFLKSLISQQPQITVDYIDISEKMIRLARKKTHNPSTVNFITGTEQNIPNRNYTVVITNFYLDLFSEQTLEHVIQKIKTHLNPEAHWLATDFVSKKWWHKIMLWSMYRFFRITTHIEAKRLPKWSSQLSAVGLSEIDSREFYGRFIKTSVYKLR